MMRVLLFMKLLMPKCCQCLSNLLECLATTSCRMRNNNLKYAISSSNIMKVLCQRVGWKDDLTNFDSPRSIVGVVVLVEFFVLFLFSSCLKLMCSFKLSSFCTAHIIKSLGEKIEINKIHNTCCLNKSL